MTEQTVQEKELAAMEQAAFLAFKDWRHNATLTYMELAKMMNNAAARAAHEFRERKVS